MITLQQIQEAHDRIRNYIHRTPIFTNESINEYIGAYVYFKCENFQKIGAFKARGGLHAVLQAAAENAKAFATHSSGNHAQALAYAAKKVGLPAYIVMPRTAPQVKKDAVRSYGAEVFECEPTLNAREEGVKKIISDKGAMLIHSFDDDRVIAGQATAAKEFIEDLDITLDAVVAPVGGGGLLSGTSLSMHYLSPSTLVFGAEPEGAADAIYSFKSGKVEKPSFIHTIADGLLTTLSNRTLTIIRAYVKNIYLVNDDEIKRSMRMIWERMKIIVEPSSAVALAMTIKNKEFFIGKRVGIIISGGNVDLDKLPF